MKDHNFLLSSTRPELLLRQIHLFHSVGKNRKINFYVFNDLDDKNEVFLSEIKKLNALSNMNVKFFDLKSQIRILQEAADKYSKDLGITKECIVNCFTENGRLQGIKSIQNKSIFIFYLLCKEKDSIVHKIDDDILPIESSWLNNCVTIDAKRDFFSNKEEILYNKPLVISGSNYTIDSPSPLVNYLDFVEFIYNFFNIAQNKSPDDEIGKDMLAISPTKVRRVFDKLSILDPLPIQDNQTYKEALMGLKGYSKLLEKGNSRIVINDNRKVSNNIYFPGGCVSFLYKNIPTLVPMFGNQDLLWEMFELLDGKKLIANDSIGHIKYETNRMSIINDLIDTSYKHQTSFTFSVFKYLKETNPRNETLLNFESAFIIPMAKWKNEANHYSHKVIQMLEKKDMWLYDDKYRKSLESVRRIIYEFIDNFENISSNYDYSKVNISTLISDYYTNKRIFDKLLKLSFNDTAFYLVF